MKKDNKFNLLQEKITKYSKYINIPNNYNKINININSDINLNKLFTNENHFLYHISSY